MSYPVFSVFARTTVIVFGYIVFALFFLTVLRLTRKPRLLWVISLIYNRVNRFGRNFSGLKPEMYAYTCSDRLYLAIECP